MKIVIMEPLGITHDALLALTMLLKADGHDMVAYDKRAESDEELIKRVHDADVIILANQPLTKRVIDQCRNLKMVDIAFTGTDHVDVNCLRYRNIMICNAAGYSTNAVAELVFGLVIDLYRTIPVCDRTVRSGGSAFKMGIELSGKKFGIVGTGSIGLRVAELAGAFGCELLGYSRHERQEGIDLGIQYKSLEEVLSESDIVSLHLPLTKDTKGLIGRAQIGMMKENALLINTARGGVVDYSALADALNREAIAGAGIDVYEQEPPLLPAHPILTAKNTILTPHIAYATRESLYQRASIVFENVRCWLIGEPQNVV